MIYLVAAFFGLLITLHAIHFDLGIERAAWGLRYVIIWSVWTTSLMVLILIFQKEGLL